MRFTDPCANERSSLAGLSDLADAALGDMRLPPPDVFGHLADRQFRHQELTTLDSYVEGNWPGVHSIVCGMDAQHSLYFDIFLHEYSYLTSQDHLPLAQWIRGAFPALHDLSICFRPVPFDRILAPGGQLYPLPADAADVQPNEPTNSES